MQTHPRTSLFLTSILAATMSSPLLAGEPPRVPSIEKPERFRLESLPPDFFVWDDEPRYREPKASTLDSINNWIIERRRHHSRQIEALGLGLDRTLSGETYIDQKNDTYLRIGAYNQYTEDGRMGFEPEIRFRLDLPTVEEKFRLIVESDSDDLAPLSEQEQRGTLTPEEQEDTGFTSGALRWLNPISDKWDASADIGARLRFPPQIFVRGRTWSDWDLADWRLRVDQRIFWYSQEGWISRSWLGFHRDLGEHWDFRASSEARWVHRNRGFELAQIFRFQRYYRNRHFVRFRIGALGDTYDSWRKTEYFSDLLYRKRLHDTWLYGEIIPAMRYRREEDFKPEASLTFRIEMFFSTSGSLN